MPRDKTETHNRLIPCILREFLENGYENASLKNIAKDAGITTAGLYRHYSSKQAMFADMVEPVTTEFFEKCKKNLLETYEKMDAKDFIENFNNYRITKNIEILNYIYDNYDVFKLLLMCSKGTPYENFEKKLIEIEINSVKEIFKELDRRQIHHNEVSDYQIRVLCAIFVIAESEAIKMGFNREEAINHVSFVGNLLYPGMEKVLGF